MDNSIKLFSDAGDNPYIPDIKANQDIDKHGEVHNKNNYNGGFNLISKGVEDALKGETVKSILIPESFDLIVPNYILDFRKADKLRKHQIMALSDLLSDDGDTAIYVYLKNGLTKLGMAPSKTLDNIMLPGIKSIFGDSCILYQDVERDKPIRELRQKDIGKVRLRI